MRRKSSAVATVIGLLLIVAYIDYLVPQEVPVDILYAIPIWLAAWAFGRVITLLIASTALGLFFVSNYILPDHFTDGVRSQNLIPATILTSFLFFGLGWVGYIFKLNQAKLKEAHSTLEKQVVDLNMLYQSSQTLVEQHSNDIATLVTKLVGYIGKVTNAKKVQLNLPIALTYLNEQFKTDEEKKESDEDTDTAAEYLSYPLWVNGENFGEIKLSGADTPNRSNLILVEALTRHLALALQNHSLYHQSMQLAVTSERNRLAREIHDVLAQGLTGILFQVEAARLNDSNPVMLQQRLEQIEQLARYNLQEARRSVANLRPLPLDGNNLVAALQQKVQNFEREQAIEAHFKLSGLPSVLPGEVETALYRICQEALSNVARHAQADWVEIALDFDEDEICLTISDNGRGFQLDKLSFSSFLVEPEDDVKVAAVVTTATNELDSIYSGGGDGGGSSTSSTSNKNALRSDEWGSGSAYTLLNKVASQQPKYGLTTMRERTRLIGGLFNIESQVSLTGRDTTGKSMGSRVRIIVPYDKIKIAQTDPAN